jgi:hypothetical protein
MHGKHRTIKNKDGLDIIYPSPLYKQLAEPAKNDDSKSTNNFDTTLYFNSDDKYWFEVNIPYYYPTKLTNL